MHVGITGASGLIGTALSTHLTSHGHTVVPFVRRSAGPGEIEWRPESGKLDPAALIGLDAVVNLAGAGIGDHRWTDAYKQTLLDSRTKGTSLLAGALATARLNGGPGVLLSGSAIGYYGDGEQAVDESSGPGDSFLAGVCVAWEAAADPARAAGLRVAALRTGIVLSRHGGALKKMLPLFRLGLGGRFGDGRQWMSWISIDDHVAAVEQLLTSEVDGAVNLTAPNPVRNTEFVDTLAEIMHRPARLPVPSFGPKLLLGGELAEALLFTGQRVEPRVLAEAGFEFRHSDLESALRAILDR
jgi:uncharacterized protein (TIGR01777 family)